MAQSKPTGTVVLSGCTNGTALAAVSAISGVPKSATSVTTGRAVLSVGNNKVLDILFAGTAAAGKTFGYQVHGLMRASRSGRMGLVAVKPAAGVVTLGALALGSGGAFVEGTASLWADTITETTADPRSSVVSPGDDTKALLRIDVSEFDYVFIDVSLEGQVGPAATMDVVFFLRDIEPGAALTTEASISLGTVQLENTAGVNINPAVSVPEDSGHSTGDPINPIGAVRTDARASLAGANADYAPPQLTNAGDVRVRDEGPSNCTGWAGSTVTNSWAICHTFTALTTEVVFSVSTYSAYVCFGNSAPSNGPTYFVNGTYRIKTCGRTGLYALNVTAGEVAVISGMDCHN